MKPTTCARLPLADKTDSPLIVASHAVAYLDRDASAIEAEPCVTITYTTGWGPAMARFTVPQARALAAALVKHADHLERVLRAVEADEPVLVPRFGVKVGDVVRIVDIPVGAVYVFNGIEQRIREPDGGRDTTNPAYFTDESQHTGKRAYKIVSLPE